LTDNLTTKAITPSLRPQGSPMAEGEAISTRTDFVRRAILERRYEPDASYAHDLLALERFLSSRSVGMAESIALSNLLSRYPREAGAIARELGVRPFVPVETAVGSPSVMVASEGKNKSGLGPTFCFRRA